MAFCLDAFGEELTTRAAAGRLDPVGGREAEIARVIRILARKTKNNPLLLGEPGVGKTAIVEGFALAVAADAVPSHLRGCTIFSLNLGNLLAGTGYRGDFELRLRDLVAYLRRDSGRCILFVDELHLLGRAGKSEGGLDAGNLLKPLLARGQLPCIGASTTAEWNDLVRLDPAFARRFQAIPVLEPSPQQALVMLTALRPRLEHHHRVRITETALVAAIAASGPRLAGRKLPDRAIDVLDEACAMVRLREGGTPNPDLLTAQADLAVAEAAFDLYTVARIRSRVLPALQTAILPEVDADAVGAVISIPGAFTDPVPDCT